MEEYGCNSNLGKGDLEKIITAIKQRTEMVAYKLVIEKDSKPSIWDSKFGGLPYWDMNQAYPVDEHGNKMMLLAQLNFSKAQLKDERLPKQGLLQFFVSVDSSVGVDYDVPDRQKNFRVIYHEQIKQDVTENQIMTLNMPIANIGNEECSPVFKEAAIQFQPITVFMSPVENDFDELFRETTKEVLGKDIGEQTALDYLVEEEYNYIVDESLAEGHKILGYPYFTQDDPRKDSKYYDTLLLQMDSEDIDGEDYVLWGEYGVANFFINSEALVRKDFSKVFYTWDCC